MITKIKKIYLCHKFEGSYENAKIITDYIKTLVSYNKAASYISPSHTFGILYDKIEPSLYSEYCISLLNDCDLMIVFDEDSKTEECEYQIDYCKKHNIPIIEYVDYCKKCIIENTFGADIE